MPNTMTSANVLVVDDTPDNIRVLTGIIERLGYEVRPATSGAQALQAVEHDPPDLVLLDITMPEMDGYEVCRRFKLDEQLRDIPIIFLTALSDIADKVKAFGVGGIDYITKPFHLEEVQARVKTHLALRCANLQLATSYSNLKALEQLRDQLVHMVVHDMRAPLMVLSGHLVLLQQESDKLSPVAANSLRTAMRSAGVLEKMANDLLDTSRLEEGKLPLQLGDHDLAELATCVGTQFRALARGRAIAVEAIGSVSVPCDNELIRRVFENLVSNAVKHTREDGAIRIAVDGRGDRVRVAVSDQGPGVPAEARQKIFEKFESVTVRKDSRYHSAGLGLAFCKLAVEAHGGQIGVQAAEPNGSTFWFELPKPRFSNSTSADATS